MTKEELEAGPLRQHLEMSYANETRQTDNGFLMREDVGTEEKEAICGRS